MEIDAVKAVLYSGAQLNFYPYFPHLFSDLGKFGIRDLGIRSLACKSFVKVGAILLFTPAICVTDMKVFIVL
jgi:hypothetical protein